LTGVSFKDKPGYAVMAKIPFEEIKLVSGIAGRPADENIRKTALQNPGDIVRVAVSLDNISAWGRVQDYMIEWPVGRMFADVSRSYPFVLK
jgi:hypothetical protein